MNMILDIFPTHIEEKKENNLKIIVDFREKNSLVIAELMNKGIGVEIKSLLVGDYIINDTVIERKTYNDFINSIMNKRLINQLEEIKQYPNFLLIIEGEEHEIAKRKIEKNAIKGFLLSVLLKGKVPILFTKDYEETAEFLYVLAKKQTGNDFSLRATKKTRNQKEQLQFVLEGFPGIGPILAKKLLNQFKSIKNIINAPEEELKKILGKKTELFMKIIHSDF
jgi:Fanconi anemia group M protein